MSATEIILIVIGVAVSLLGYLMPARKKDIDEEVLLISEDEVRKLIAGEVEHVKERISDIVDETVNYSIEKAERAMERVTNEKIMAINEYSDTVLEEINKNHKEVVFLYDMLNDKHDNLMSAINEATMAADDMKQTVKDAEITANEAEDRLDTVLQAIDDAEETARDAENAAIQVQRAADKAMNTVIQAVERAKNDLAALHSTRVNREKTEEPVRKQIMAEEAAVIPKPEVKAKDVPVSEDQGEIHEEEMWEETPEDTADVPDMPKPDKLGAGVIEVPAKKVIRPVLEEPEEEKVEFKPISPRRVEIVHQPDGDYVAEEEDMPTSAAFASMGIFAPKDEEPEIPARKTRARRSSRRERVQETTSAVDIRFAQGKDNGRNSNERILELHKAGKSNMAIAKDLGLGLGEVKLVIDLFEGM